MDENAPPCERCGKRKAMWLVRVGGVVGLGSARWMLCATCAGENAGSKRRIKPRDYS